MMRRRTSLAALAITAVVGLTVYAAGTLSGQSWCGVTLDPSVGFTCLDLGVDVSYTLGGVALGTDSLFLVPGLWVWQGFTASGYLGGFGIDGSLLLGGSPAAFLFAEAIASLSLSGIDFALHAAQLGAAVHGGPANGAAIRLAGSLGACDVVSTTEFGVQIEDEDFGGISIVHAATGRARHYLSDPRGANEGFTGQKVRVSHTGFCHGGEATATAYLRCGAFEYASLRLEDLSLANLAWLAVDAEFMLKVQSKSVIVSPKLVLGDSACLQLYAGPVPTASGTGVDSVRIYGLELTCEIGRVTLRDVTRFEPHEVGLTTEPYGSRLLLVREILAKGLDYYPDYWQLLSVSYGGEGCCDGTYGLLVNSYFDTASTTLFDWAMLHAEATVPLGDSISLGLGLEIGPVGVIHLQCSCTMEW